jgi:VIT1/CCC1 family predicted Fe2+/Mn2+ transporter
VNNAANIVGADSVRQSECKPFIPASEIHYFSWEVVESVAQLFCILLSTVVLMVPIFVFFFGRVSYTIAPVIVLVCTLFFTAAMSILTGGDMKDVFMGSCA